MKILVTGSTGLVGSNLIFYLTSNGHNILTLSRDKQAPLYWDIEKKIIPKESLEDLDAVIHLSGENIVKKRWTPLFKEKLWKSRVGSTDFLVSTLLSLKNPPRTFISASAIGIYGDRENEQLFEYSNPGTGFLADLCSAWENASKPLQQRNIRVIHMRFGAILSELGGMLHKMLPLYKLGLGSVIGNGKQYMSWIALEDVICSIEHVLLNSSLSGPVNCTSPFSITNYDFTKTLGFILKRPTFLKMPGFIARILFGEMAKALFLSSVNAYPKILIENHYSFRHPILKDFLKQKLSRD
ncbi:MAG: TIGR01777 family oxidoreductase [Chlamydiales bacterium]|nr:TIGR01777 family oxidoreductase [Chlamydiales bacterium]